VLARVALLESKPFWRDEAWVASLSGEPLDWTMSGPRKAVPVGFLAVTRLMGGLPLPPEIALRLLPLAAGLAAILVVATLVRRLGGGRTTAVLALFLGAGLQGLIYYSRELKPYSLDLLLAALVPLLSLDTLHSRAPFARRRPAWAGLAVVALVAPWLSFGSVFCLSATFALATVFWWRRAHSEARGAWVVILLLWLLSFGALFELALETQANNPRMLNEWADDMAFLHGAPLLQQPLIGLGAYAHTSLAYLFPEVWGAALALILVGVLAAPRASRRVLGGLFLVTALGVVGAAILERYVLTQGRLLLFTAPAYISFAALGLLALARRLSPARGPGLALGATALFASLWCVQSIAHRLPPYRDDPRLYFRFDILHDLEPIIESARLLAAPGEPVFVSRYSGEMFRYYSRGRLPLATICTRFNCRNEPPVVYDWARGVERRGFMILLDSDDGPARRAILDDAGCDASVVAQARGARLLRVTRRTARAGG
jgi:hypothetical protein